MGPDQTVEIMRRLLIEAMLLERSAAGDGVRGEPGGEPGADADQRAGADVDCGAAAGGGVCRHGGDDALDGASAGELHGASVDGLSPVPGIGSGCGMNRELSGLIEDWPQYLTAAVAGDGAAERADGVRSGVFVAGDCTADQSRVCVCDDDAAGSGGSGGSWGASGAGYRRRCLGSLGWGWCLGFR